MNPEQNPNEGNLGQSLRAIREGAGLSRRGLAKAANVDHAHLSRVESGERAMSPALLSRVLRAIAESLTGRSAA
jgi:transcriptional regulator with XRE-family HTH domain